MYHYSELFIENMQTNEPLRTAKQLASEENKAQLNRWMRRIVERSDQKLAYAQERAHGMRVR